MQISNKSTQPKGGMQINEKSLTQPNKNGTCIYLNIHISPS